MIIKRKIFDKCKFDENLKAIEEYDMWFQIIGKGFKLKGINRNFYYYRIHPEQISQNKLQLKKSREYILQKLKSGDYLKSQTLKTLKNIR